MTAGDWIVVAVLCLCVGACIWSMIKNRKKGGCSGNCASCGGCCHKQ